jgi:hypothetical protein
MLAVATIPRRVVAPQDESATESLIGRRVHNPLRLTASRTGPRTHPLEGDGVSFPAPASGEPMGRHYAVFHCLPLNRQLGPVASVEHAKLGEDSASNRNPLGLDPPALGGFDLQREVMNLAPVAVPRALAKSERYRLARVPPM